MLSCVCAIEHREELEFQVVFSPVNFSSSYIMLITVRLHSFEQMFRRLDTSFADRAAFCAVCGEGRSKSV